LQQPLCLYDNLLFLFGMTEEKSSYLFVYGTLLDESAPYGAYLKENSSFLAEGKFKGELYDIGNYPGAISNPDAGGFVHGAVFNINDPAAVLNELDDYEGFGDAFLQPNEFVRALVSIETATGPLNCWAYLYNHSIKPSQRIQSGKYSINP